MNECDQRLYRVLSSRRRDTIYWRDWSSDVCSSDLDRMVTPAPVDEYVAGLPGDMRQRVDQVRRLVAAAVPGAAETIRYGTPTFTVDGRSLVHVTVWTRHVALHPLDRKSTRLNSSHANISYAVF